MTTSQLRVKKKIVSQAFEIANVRFPNNKIDYFEKLLCNKQVFAKTTIAISLNLHQVCSSVAPFLFAMLPVPSFNVLSN